MKLFSIAFVALMAATPAVAQTTIDFEAVPGGFGTSILDFYSGVGVSFGADALLVNNDAAGPYFRDAPSPIGVMYAAPGVIGGGPSLSWMNVAAGFTGAVSFFYASLATITQGVEIYSGLDGTGTLLGFFNLAANAAPGTCGFNSGGDPIQSCNFDSISQTFNGVAQSVLFRNSAGFALYDDITITPVPEPSTILLMLAGLGALGLIARRRV